MRVRVSSKGQIVFPAEIRRKYGIEAGSELDLVEWAGTLYISSVNLCEVLYVVRRKAGMDCASRASSWLKRVPMQVVNADEYTAIYAAELKHRHALGLGDAFAAGLAFALDAPLLTGDADFLPLAGHGLRLDWVGAEQLQTSVSDPLAMLCARDGDDV